MYENVNGHYLREAWLDLNHKSNMVKYHQRRNKQNAVKQMKDIDLKMQHKILKKMFDKFHNAGVKRDQKDKYLLQLINRQITRFYRDVFMIWKKESNFREVEWYINNLGPQAMEVEDIK